jgi:hypothetical protein
MMTTKAVVERRGFMGSMLRGWLPLAFAVCLLAPGLAGAPPAAQDKPDPNPPDRKAIDRQIYNTLRDVINRGAGLYNSGDQVGCYRLFEGALMAMRPLLEHRPDLQKAIDAGLANAERSRTWSQGAFALREALDRVRAEVVSADAPPRKPDDKRPLPKDVPVNPPDESAKVTAKVVAAGLPLEDADVQLLSREDFKEPGVRGKTALDGSVDLKAVKPGLYVVLISKRGLKDGMMRNLLPEAYGDRSQSPLRVEVVKGNNLLLIDVPLDAEAKKSAAKRPVEGVVTYRGKPLAGAEIRLVPENDRGAKGYTATLDANGKFMLPDVKPEQYVVVVVKSVVAVPDSWKDPQMSDLLFDFRKMKP